MTALHVTFPTPGALFPAGYAAEAATVSRAHHNSRFFPEIGHIA